MSVPVKIRLNIIISLITPRGGDYRGTTDDSESHLPSVLIVSCTQQKTSLFIPRCYLPTSFYVCLFVFLYLALCPAEWFLPGLIGLVTCPCHIIFLIFTMLSRPSCDPKAALILFLTSSFGMWSVYEMFKIIQ